MPPNQVESIEGRPRPSPGPLRDRLNPSASHQCPMASHHQIECHLRAFGLVRCFTTVSMRQEGGDAVPPGATRPAESMEGRPRPASRPAGTA